jgi:hypothetical protein
VAVVSELDKVKVPTVVEAPLANPSVGDPLASQSLGGLIDEQTSKVPKGLRLSPCTIFQLGSDDVKLTKLTLAEAGGFSGRLKPVLTRRELVTGDPERFFRESVIFPTVVSEKV